MSADAVATNNGVINEDWWDSSHQPQIQHVDQQWQREQQPRPRPQHHQHHHQQQWQQQQPAPVAQAPALRYSATHTDPAQLQQPYNPDPLLWHAVTATAPLDNGATHHAADARSPGDQATRPLGMAAAAATLAAWEKDQEKEMEQRQQRTAIHEYSYMVQQQHHQQKQRSLQNARTMEVLAETVAAGANAQQAQMFAVAARRREMARRFAELRQ